MARPDDTVPNVVELHIGDDPITFKIHAEQPGRSFPDYSAQFVTLIYIDFYEHEITQARRRSNKQAMLNV